MPVIGIPLANRGVIQFKNWKINVPLFDTDSSLSVEEQGNLTFPRYRMVVTAITRRMGVWRFASLARTGK
jgi:hypothetical protein